MKSFLNLIPRFWKGIYFMWFTLHFVLFLVSGNLFHYHRAFYPFYIWGSTALDISRYDYSEFFIYTVVPILVALIIYYLKPQKDDD